MALRQVLEAPLSASSLPSSSTGTVTRFAPSPTGDLHLGHAYSALFAAEQAKRDGGTFLLRIEDIDITRCRPEHEAANLEDLRWLGLSWPEPVRRQSEHFGFYQAALGRLEAMGLLYRCFLSRRELNDALSAPHGVPAEAPTDTDTLLSDTERQRRLDAGKPFALRLRMSRAIEHAGPLTWTDRHHGEHPARPEMFGDVVLARRDIPTSYHLAVTLDDALQGISLVTRGKDLLDATHIHRLPATWRFFATSCPLSISPSPSRICVPPGTARRKYVPWPNRSPRYGLPTEAHSAPPNSRIRYLSLHGAVGLNCSNA